MRRKEKKKGFTLIELLAVIVILAIIALIATPMILGVIEKSRKSAFQDSVYSIFEAVDYYKIEHEIGSLPREGISVQELNLKNKDEFISGLLKENEKEIRIENISNGIYCGNGTMNNLEISKRNCGIATEEKYFTFNKSTGTITDYSNEGPKDVIIPNKINGISVTSIGNDAFYDNQLKSITIPNSVTNIGNSVFAANQLTNVIIPNSVTSIGSAAFRNNQLPDDQAFIYNRKSDGSEDKTSLNSYGGARRENIIIPSGVTRIGGWAFLNDQITNITIPNSVRIIETRAFYRNPIEAVTIPTSVMVIEKEAFNGGGQLKSVKIIGKASSSEFTSYGTNIWGFASGYNDTNITWNASE